MKTKLSAFLTAIAGGLISAMPAQAASFNNSGIYFDQDTKVDFMFQGSYNYWMSDFGVVNWETGEYTTLIEEVQNADNQGGVDNEGTVAGGTVLEPSASYTFEAGTKYSLFITSLEPDGSDPFEGSSLEGLGINTIYSTDMKNPSWFNVVGGIGYNPLTGEFTVGEGPDIPDNLNNYDPSLNGTLTANGQQRAIFQYDLFVDGHALVLFEDTTPNGADNDFDDFIVKATIHADVPEPATLAGLGMVAGAMFLSRSGKKQK